MGCILHRFRFPDLADFILARLRLLLANLLEVHCSCFRRILAFLPRLVYVQRPRSPRLAPIDDG
jgi:hypothetical protein